MRVRQIDSLHDWTFGKGRNNYLTGIAAVSQNIDTRLSSFLGDCFFDLGAGLDWFNLLGSKDELTLRLNISTVILNTVDVIGIVLISTRLDPNTRDYTVNYSVDTTYGVLSNAFNFTPVVG